VWRNRSVWFFKAIYLTGRWIEPTKRPILLQLNKWIEESKEIKFLKIEYQLIYHQKESREFLERINDIPTFFRGPTLERQFFIEVPFLFSRLFTIEVKNMTYSPFPTVFKRVLRSRFIKTVYHVWDRLYLAVHSQSNWKDVLSQWSFWRPFVV